MSQRMNYNAALPAGMKGLGAVYGYVRQSGGFPRGWSISCSCAYPRSTDAPIASTCIRATSSRLISFRATAHGARRLILRPAR